MIERSLPLRESSFCIEETHHGFESSIPGISFRFRKYSVDASGWMQEIMPVT